MRNPWPKRTHISRPVQTVRAVQLPWRRQSWIHGRSQWSCAAVPYLCWIVKQQTVLRGTSEGHNATLCQGVPPLSSKEVKVQIHQSEFRLFCLFSGDEWHPTATFVSHPCSWFSAGGWSETLTEHVAMPIFFLCENKLFKPDWEWKSKVEPAQFRSCQVLCCWSLWGGKSSKRTASHNDPTQLETTLNWNENDWNPVKLNGENWHW